MTKITRRKERKLVPDRISTLRLRSESSNSGSADDSSSTPTRKGKTIFSRKGQAVLVSYAKNRKSPPKGKRVTNAFASRCPVCKQYISVTSLLSHLRKVHSIGVDRNRRKAKRKHGHPKRAKTAETATKSAEAILRCNHCGQLFFSREMLQRHLRIHRKEKPIGQSIFETDADGDKKSKRVKSTITRYTVTNVGRPWEGGLPGSGKRR